MPLCFQRQNHRTVFARLSREKLLVDMRRLGRAISHTTVPSSRGRWTCGIPIFSLHAVRAELGRQPRLAVWRVRLRFSYPCEWTRLSLFKAASGGSRAGDETGLVEHYFPIAQTGWRCNRAILAHCLFETCVCHRSQSKRK